MTGKVRATVNPSREQEMDDIPARYNARIAEENIYLPEVAIVFNGHFDILVER